MNQYYAPTIQEVCFLLAEAAAIHVAAGTKLSHGLPQLRLAMTNIVDLGQCFSAENSNAIALTPWLYHVSGCQANRGFARRRRIAILLKSVNRHHLSVDFLSFGSNW